MEESGLPPDFSIDMLKLFSKKTFLHINIETLGFISLNNNMVFTGVEYLLDREISKAGTRIQSVWQVVKIWKDNNDIPQARINRQQD